MLGNRRSALLTMIVVAAALAGTAWSVSAEDSPLRPEPNLADAAFRADVLPIMARHCNQCHSGEKARAGLELDQFKDHASVVKDRASWDKVLEHVRTGSMPPEGKSQPSADERRKFISWIESHVFNVDCGAGIDPGRVTIRRLNRVEYNNTIRDLVGVPFKPAADFPTDDLGYGFDNIGDVLSLPPILLEKYLAAAEKIAESAIVAADPTHAPVVRFAGNELFQLEKDEPEQKPADKKAAKKNRTKGRKKEKSTGGLPSNGSLFMEHQFAKKADYIIRVGAYAQQAGPEPARMTIRVNGKDVHTCDVPAVAGNTGSYEVRVPVTAGKRRVDVAFINDYYNPKEKPGDRNLYIESLEIRGPIGVLPDDLPESHKRIITCQPTGSDRSACAQIIIRKFASRAFRRPATDEEVARFVRLVDLAAAEGDSFERGIQLAVEAVLVSPHFLFRVERNNPLDEGAVNTLRDYELASRLSYFLWSSMPDEELMRMAGQGTLHQSKTYESQVRRMLKDPRSQALVENFAGQWLQLRNLATLTPEKPAFTPLDKAILGAQAAADKIAGSVAKSKDKSKQKAKDANSPPPEEDTGTFDEALRDAMKVESEMLFATIMRDDRPIFDFLDADFTFLNERLARHYGIKGVTGTEFRRVSLAGTERGGILGHASVLSVTSNPTRTSPVKRGKWILENILGTPPPPPPPDVPELSEEKDKVLSGSLRQRMEQHRSNPNCATCHQRMDPLGFGLENFDMIGAWRTKDGQFEIDASGVLPGGEKFTGPTQLRAILKTRQVDFRRCLTEKMLTYALGRGLERYDQCAVEKITEKVGRGQNKFSALVLEIVNSEPFLKRRAKQGEP